MLWFSNKEYHTTLCKERQKKEYKIKICKVLVVRYVLTYIYLANNDPETNMYVWLFVYTICRQIKKYFLNPLQNHFVFCSIRRLNGLFLCNGSGPRKEVP